MELGDGREFVFARAGATGLDNAKLMQESVVETGHGVDLLVAAIAAIGATTVTLTNATTPITANMYAQGTLHVNDGTGEGQICKIKSHPAEATGTGSVVITLEDEDALRVALAVGSEVGLNRHPCDDVVVAPTTFTGVVVGATVCAVTAAYYCWLQTKGDASLLTNGTVVLGKAVSRSATTAGAIDVRPLNSSDNDGQEQTIGTVRRVGATTEYSLIRLNI